MSAAAESPRGSRIEDSRVGDAATDASGRRPEGRRPLVKICGLTDAGDARRADGLGADYLGVVLTPGFGRSVLLEAAGTFFEATTARRVAVLVDERPGEAGRKARSIGASVLQLHGEEGPEVVRALRGEGNWAIWKAVRAASVDDVLRAVDRLGELVHGLVVEGRRDGVVGGGGVRLTLDPTALRDAVPAHLDFVLAGGLTPESVAEVVARYQPDVVDVSSGVEDAPGRKDEALVTAFIHSARHSRSS